MLVNTGGAEAIQSILAIIPMLLVSLLIVFGLQAVGAIDWLVAACAPGLAFAGISDVFVVPAVTKYLAGNTAFVGLIYELTKQPDFEATALWKGAGFLLHPVDLPGIAILTSGGPRLMSTLWPAIAGAIVDIILKGSATASWG